MVIMAMLRDASAFWCPDTRSPKKYHVEVGDAISACTGNPLAEFTAQAATEVPVSQRCQRSGCQVRWPAMEV